MKVHVQTACVRAWVPGYTPGDVQQQWPLWRWAAGKWGAQGVVDTGTIGDGTRWSHPNRPQYPLSNPQSNPMDSRFLPPSRSSISAVSSRRYKQTDALSGEWVAHLVASEELQRNERSSDAYSGPLNLKVKDTQQLQDPHFIFSGGRVVVSF